MIRRWMCIAAGVALLVALAAPMRAQDNDQQFYDQQSWGRSDMDDQSYDQDFGDYDQQDYDADLDNDQQGMTSIGPYSQPGMGTYNQQGMGAGTGDYGQGFGGYAEQAAGAGGYGQQQGYGAYGQQGYGTGMGTYGQPGFGTGAGGGFGAGTGTGAQDYNDMGAGGLASYAEYNQPGYGAYDQWGYGQAGMGGQPYYGYTPGYAPPYYYQPGVSPQGITRLSGRIIDMRIINRYGQNHVFATVRTSEGATAVADLGPVSEVNRLNLKNGDTVQVAGFQSMVNQRPVLLATRVRANNKTITNRPDIQFRGRVVQTATRTVGGESHVFATVDLDNGRRVTVDFGPRRYLQDNKIRIRANEEVSFLAHSARVGNRTIYRARSLNIAGRQITVPSSTRGGSEEAREATRGSFLIE